jgi:hypothetical protein
VKGSQEKTKQKTRPQLEDGLDRGTTSIDLAKGESPLGD